MKMADFLSNQPFCSEDLMTTSEHVRKAGDLSIYKSKSTIPFAEAVEATAAAAAAAAAAAGKIRSGEFRSC